MDKNKIEIKDLYLIFGSERNKAFKMLKKGKSKSELLKMYGCREQREPLCPGR